MQGMILPNYVPRVRKNWALPSILAWHSGLGLFYGRHLNLVRVAVLGPAFWPHVVFLKSRQKQAKTKDYTPHHQLFFAGWTSDPHGHTPYQFVILHEIILILPVIGLRPIILAG